MTKETSELPSAEEFTETWAAISDDVRELLEEYSKAQAQPDAAAPSGDEISLLTRPFETFMERTSADPSGMVSAQMEYWRDISTLWQRMGQRALGLDVEPVVSPERSDRRFKDEAWTENPIFDFIKQSYLLSSRHLASTVPQSEGDDDKRAQQLEFHTRQFVDAMSPSNFVATNPEVLRETVASGGQNLVDGLRNLLSDLKRGNGQLRIKMTDLDKFKVGENIGTSAGKVVYETPLMQLIQYSPTTPQVYTRPILIMPPWINKFYILDLQPKNSFIRWAVEQGHTVFVISWVNPGSELAEKSFDDYLTEGSLAALDAIAEATGVKDVNLVGYCLGGTLLACTLAHLAAKGDKRAKSATYFASLADFSNPGELGLFIDEEHISVIESQMEKDGYLDGATMATTFNSLRANDLIWSFVVNNYLMGKEPLPFDLLYWNSDSTRMPRAMHSFYLRQMYLENRLMQPGGISLLGTPIDLRQITTPTYIVSTKDDHIAPWKSTYSVTQLYGGSTRFVLGGSGHIAGIINPPSANKYGHWINSELPPTPDEWLEGATQKDGSWWTDWQKWVRRYGGKKVASRTPGDGKLEPIEDTPGRYVLVR
jgi:polyhydroxyalkanoate synthase subunit PhaC